AWELFEADARIEHLPIAYPRGGSLRERLDAWRALRQALSQPQSIVIDPDSRLTQLGLAPVCAEQDYYFFESRAHGGARDGTARAPPQRRGRRSLRSGASGGHLRPRH